VIRGLSKTLSDAAAGKPAPFGGCRLPSKSGIKYVRYNFWPTAQFVDLADLNRQAQAWTAGIANLRTHGTTGERPADRLGEEHPHLLPVPSRERVQPFLRDERIVGREGFVAWERAWYGACRGAGPGRPSA
jgi:hypothetical protein